jgi:hypothetical protein
LYGQPQIVRQLDDGSRKLGPAASAAVMVARCGWQHVALSLLFTQGTSFVYITTELIITVLSASALLRVFFSTGDGFQVYFPGAL